MKKISVIGMGVSPVTAESLAELVCNWVKSANFGRYVVFANAHVLVTGNQAPDFSKVLEAADIVAPDGFPVAWMLRRLGSPNQSRVPGPDFMNLLFRRAEQLGISVFFYGSHNSTLDKLKLNLCRSFPGLNISGVYSPPFSAISSLENKKIIDHINSLGPGIIFVGLGCPKQEYWMFNNANKLNSVLLGVGAGFDFHAGTLRRAPEWMGRIGMEWIYRLVSEPKRLFFRYLVTNTVFVFKAAGQLFRRDSSH
ncbi:WecB/TagA/CpsF family glycosyltransferase [Curvibacter sp. HBC28]|uniref:WecB/TagA/CpsF family glycosyltransferase n=1 Tax=Curvibacter microcysteis TaxID=3026419 RepID=A0ABT5MFA1_9BURK|nr:WecB/TagA/CpsF family glycosyltransferase [Curvibacter sp. HBC28]MDD0814592.1 WecB/TagA/CpsF family glycosyltransferase [Curvibacter sp. HBC28]